MFFGVFGDSFVINFNCSSAFDSIIGLFLDDFGVFDAFLTTSQTHVIH